MPAHEHNHKHSGNRDSHENAGLSGRKIFWVTILNAAITAAEIVGGVLSGSLSLLSDAAHNFSDTAAVALSYFAGRIARKPHDARKTYGYKRAEILSAFINAAVLLGISVVLIYEAIRRWASPETIDSGMMMAVALIGLFANLFSAILLHKDAHGSLNIRASYLHLLGDTVSSVGVLAGGIIIQIWHISWVDPLVTLLISLYLIKESWHVVRMTMDILMQSAADLDAGAIRDEVRKIGKVNDIHHLHSWMIDENTILLEAHISMDDMPLSEAEQICGQIEDLLKDEFGVSHVTLQAEVIRCADKNICEM